MGNNQQSVVALINTVSVAPEETILCENILYTRQKELYLTCLDL